MRVNVLPKRVMVESRLAFAGERRLPRKASSTGALTARQGAVVDGRRKPAFD